MQGILSGASQQGFGPLVWETTMLHLSFGCFLVVFGACCHLHPFTDIVVCHFLQPVQLCSRHATKATSTCRCFWSHRELGLGMRMLMGLVASRSLPAISLLGSCALDWARQNNLTSRGDFSAGSRACGGSRGKALDSPKDRGKTDY